MVRCADKKLKGGKRMAVGNIIEGRNRAIEVLNWLEPDDGEILYGERNGGIGYCPFMYTKNHATHVATVRTTDRDFVKIDPRVLETNMSAAEERDLEHILIVGFNWLSSKTVFLIKNCDRYIHHQTTGKKYQVFRKDHLFSLATGDSYYARDVQLL